MRRVMPFMLAAFTAGTLLAQSRALNPTVKVDPRSKSAVPVECEEGAVPQQTPRIQVAELPQETTVRADMQPPRSNDLRAQFRELHAAAERNDREGFKQMLDVARATVAAYPPGGEKSAAADALAVYGDIERLWEYQYSSPTGAFFDASVQDGALLKMLSAYRGFDEAMRRNVIVDANGTKIYPTRESREFLAREAAQRLTRIGVRPGAPAVAAAPAPAREKPIVRSEPAAPPVTKATKPSAASVRATKPSTRKRVHSTAPRTSVKKSPSRAAKRSAQPVAPEKSVLEEPPMPPGVVSAPAESPARASTPPASTSTMRTEPVPQASATAAPVSETVGRQSSETVAPPSESVQPAESPRPTPAQNAARSRNIVMPLVLILIGVGVLVVLFRASS